MLGFEIRAHQLSVPQRARVAIDALQTPTTRKHVQQALGLLNYYRRFIKNFATIARPLTDVLQREWVWGPAQTEAFAALKESLIAEPLLRLPLRVGEEGYSPYVVETDASDRAIAGVLSQRAPDDGQLHPCGYTSRVLRGPELNYSATEREALAMVYTVRQFRYLLLGGPFTIFTDHQPLTFLLSVKEPAGRLARWIAALQQYTFTIRYRPGAVNVNVDALSRLPIDDPMSQQTQPPPLAVALLGVHLIHGRLPHGMRHKLTLVRPVADWDRVYWSWLW